jgi:hypothetical protein
MRLGLLVPLVTLVFLGADLALRTGALERSAFRAWDPLVAQGGGDRPFAPDRSIVTERSYGDLSALCNRPELRQYRRELFSTDRWGYRNPPDLADGGGIAALMIGDSFTAGGGVSDDETLPAQLSLLSGRKVYNGGGIRIGRKGRLGRLLDRLRMEDGVVFHVVLERGLQGRDAEPEEGAPRPRFVERWMRTSRLRILAEAGLKGLQSSGIFPNAHASRVAVRELRDGRAMLFLPSDVGAYEKPPASNPRLVQDLSDLAREVRARGLRYVAVLVPYKYGVYGPLLKGAGELPESPLGLLEQDLVRAGIPVLNTVPLLRRAAEEALPQGRTLYWLDDTHWNAAGIRVAAEAVEKFWRALPPR